MSDLEFNFGDEEIADEMEALSDGDRTLNERLSSSNALASANGSFKNEAARVAVKETSVKNVSFSNKYATAETAKRSSLKPPS